VEAEYSGDVEGMVDRGGPHEGVWGGRPWDDLLTVGIASELQVWHDWMTGATY